MEQLQNLDLSPMSAVGAALLRIILAGFWIAHWWFKVGYRGMPATEAFFLQQGLPAWLAWFDISFEVVVAVCFVLGILCPYFAWSACGSFLLRCGYIAEMDFIFRAGELSFRFCGHVRKSPRSFLVLVLFGSHFRCGCNSLLYSVSRSDYGCAAPGQICGQV